MVKLVRRKSQNTTNYFDFYAIYAFLDEIFSKVDSLGSPITQAIAVNLKHISVRYSIYINNDEIGSNTINLLHYLYEREARSVFLLLLDNIQLLLSSLSRTKDAICSVQVSLLNSEELLIYTQFDANPFILEDTELNNQRTILNFLTYGAPKDFFDKELSNETLQAIEEANTLIKSMR